jgi:hypothetical protein
VPNPNPQKLAVDLQSACDDLRLRVYTRGWTLALELHGGPQAAGWNRWVLPNGWSLPLAPGAYFATLEALRGPATSSRTVVKLVILR